MNTKQTIWLAPVIAVILFGFGLAGMAYFNTGAITSFNITVGTDYPLLVRVNALVQDVDTLSDGFADVTSGEGRSLQALAGQAQRVHEQLRTLGALPGQTVLAARLTQEFEAWYRPAMQARIPPAQEPAEAGAATDAMQQNYAVLNADLQQARQHALRRFTESASASHSDAQSLLRIMVVMAGLMVLGLAIVAWLAMRSNRQQPDGGTAHAHADAAVPDDQHSVLVQLNIMREYIDTIVAGVRAMARNRRHANTSASPRCLPERPTTGA
jgi:uncharacterized protein YbjQ (UPF0145 family)